LRDLKGEKREVSLSAKIIFPAKKRSQTF